MTVTVGTHHLELPRIRPARPDVLFFVTVLLAYGLATALAVLVCRANPDYLMAVAERAYTGHLDSPALKGAVDSVFIDGRYYMALGPAQLAAYMPFAAVPALQGVGKYLAGMAFGIPAACLALPVARAFGAKDVAAIRIAQFTAFGSMLFYTAVLGDMYYLAHVESFLALMIFLLEWQGRRRAWVLGAMLAFSFLARPTTLVAALPFGLALLWGARREPKAAARTALAFGIPIVVAIGIYGWFNWVRFGSPLESGYALSYLSQPDLVARRDMGIFSIRQIPENLSLAFLALPRLVDYFPYIVPSQWGLSIVLVSPALFLSLRAGIRDHTAQLLWIATALVALPVFLYYGGGFQQYGFRYSLDFTPFLIALIAIGSRGRVGLAERLLIVASLVSISYGIFWELVWHY